MVGAIIDFISTSSIKYSNLASLVSNAVSAFDDPMPSPPERNTVTSGGPTL